MATSLAALTARRAAAVARLSPSSSSANRAASLIPRRGLSGASERHSPPKVPIWKWKVPLMDSNIANKDRREVRHFLPWIKQDKEEKVAEPAK